MPRKRTCSGDPNQAILFNSQILSHCDIVVPPIPPLPPSATDNQELVKWCAALRQQMASFINTVNARNAQTSLEIVQLKDELEALKVELATKAVDSNKKHADMIVTSRYLTGDATHSKVAGKDLPDDANFEAELKDWQEWQHARQTEIDKELNKKQESAAKKEHIGMIISSMHLYAAVDIYLKYTLGLGDDYFQMRTIGECCTDPELRHVLGNLLENRKSILSLDDLDELRAPIWHSPRRNLDGLPSKEEFMASLDNFQIFDVTRAKLIEMLGELSVF